MLEGGPDDVMEASSLSLGVAAAFCSAVTVLVDVPLASLSGYLVGGVHHGRDGEGQRHLPGHRPYPSGGLS